ncbi:MAG: hypothetical protein V3V08_14495 [Nannocystaceae bacterium]
MPNHTVHLVAYRELMLENLAALGRELENLRNAVEQARDEFGHNELSTNQSTDAAPKP